jgi:acyl-coenzyme A thioesterase PaaI-like protein
VTGAGVFNPAVNWVASSGSIDANGNYTAPGTATTATITATSVQDQSKSGTAQIDVQPMSSPAITSVSVSCSPSSIQINGTSKCSATVTGAGVFNPAVNWVASSGSIDANGNYTAPGTATTTTITATSVQDQSKSGTAQIDVLPVSSTNSLVFNGSANLAGNVVSLTQDNMFNQDAAVWYNNTVDVSNGFHTTFQFQISSPTFGSLASDGLAFVVQNTGTPAIGDAASGGVEVGLHNLGPGIAVVFRTFNTNSVEIASCGPTKSVDIGCPVAQTPSGSVVVNDGAIHSAIIDYTLGQLQITVDGVLVLSTPIDIASQLTLTNGKAFVGFTAATGGRTEEADLKLWSYSSSGSGISFP